MAGQYQWSFWVHNAGVLKNLKVWNKNDVVVVLLLDKNMAVFDDCENVLTQFDTRTLIINRVTETP